MLATGEKYSRALPKPSLRTRVAVLLSPFEAGVEVLNGTPSAGLAKRAAETLRAGGFQSVRYDDALRPQTITAIEVRTGARRAGLKVASLLSQEPDSVRESVNLPDDLDVRVTLGGQYAAR